MKIADENHPMEEMIKKELTELLDEYYNDSFPQMGCEYICHGDDAGRSGGAVGSDEEGVIIGYPFGSKLVDIFSHWRHVGRK